MQLFLVKLINYTVENEKKFDANRKRLTSMNKFFYEYERLSSDCYSIDQTKIQGQNEENK